LKTSIIILGHGSQAEGGSDALREVADMVSGLAGYEVVPAFLQFESPSLTEAVETAISEGGERIVVVPYFLYTGNHVIRDIPEELDKLKAAHPGVQMVMTGHLGAHRKLAEIVLERIRGG